MTESTRPAVLAIDPGLSKCGIAIVDECGCVLHRSVVPAAECERAVSELVSRFDIAAVVVGNGTGSSSIQAWIAAAAPGVTLDVVDERHTSEEARARRVAEERRGWRRLVPASLLTPSSSYDDLVAAILAERWWLARSDKVHTRDLD